MPSIKHRNNKKLLHSRPVSEAEFNDNLTHLAKHEQIHRLQQQHHLRVAQMHADQAKVMQRLSTTNPVAKIHHGYENNLAERHKQAAALHGREIDRVKVLRQHQKIGRDKLRKRERQSPKLTRGKSRRRHRARAKDEGKLGNISRIQLGTRFGINQVMDFNRAWLRMTPQNLIDPVPPNLPPQQVAKMSKRIKNLTKKDFKIGTMTNSRPSGMYYKETEFGFPKSTM